jgi:pilus assembly protein Flp/PilA
MAVTLWSRSVSGIFRLWIRLLRSDGGATAIEYALIAGFVSIAIVAGATAVGTNLGTSFTTVATGLK